MTQTHRFGRRIALPATIQILHELLILSAHEDAGKQRAADKGRIRVCLRLLGKP